MLPRRGLEHDYRRSQLARGEPRERRSPDRLGHHHEHSQRCHLAWRGARHRHEYGPLHAGSGAGVMATKTPREQLGVDLPDPQRPETFIEPPAPEADDDRPDWLPEKFKSVEEYNASYKSLEDELRRRGEDQNRMQAELADMRQMMDEDREQRQQQSFQGPPQNEQQLREQLQVAYENDPIGTMAYLAQQYANQTIDARLQALQADNRPA